MCDGENRLKAERAWFLDWKERRARPEIESIFLAGENWRGFEITILITRYSFHHGFGDASLFGFHA